MQAAVVEASDEMARARAEIEREEEEQRRRRRVLAIQLNDRATGKKEFEGMGEGLRRGFARGFGRSDSSDAEGLRVEEVVDDEEVMEEKQNVASDGEEEDAEVLNVETSEVLEKNPPSDFASMASGLRRGFAKGFGDHETTEPTGQELEKINTNEGDKEQDNVQAEAAIAAVGAEERQQPPTRNPKQSSPGWELV